jgi:VanZ family protein
MKRWWRALAVASVVSILALSLVPGTLRPHTVILPSAFEHVAAYMVAAFFLCLSYHRRVPPIWLVLFLTAYGACLEFGQLWVPGRNGNLLDIGADLTGALIGMMVALATTRLRSPPLAR